ncbi:uncharacterized protein LOC113524587 [Pangasianodon hypophthalmus]|uniref:uncharacterized protein LOC113524587 n=1 Tax=Pangasianodon hypophthalmus TaxID=310915 RepID=UPI000EFF9EDC|nr:uncharacterized protein LOC113524587 [Pangasianodon hypophthalmus]
MASKIPSGSKRPREPSAQGLKVKFLINIPLKVDSKDEAQKRCGYLLDALSEGFKEKDRTFMKDKNGKDVLEDVAVIFGMNGRHTPELAKVLKELQTFKYNCKYMNIKYSIITYTWGSGGTIAPDATKVPYQDIREHLKNDAATRKLVKEFRENDPKCLVYFSFVDSDTFKFNFIYSEYLEIVREVLKKDAIPPTVMSTGYEFTHDSEHYVASRLDRTVRVALAEVNPLLVYYPEPNFCVLVRDGLNTIEESFIKPKRGKGEYGMESPVLISQVKERVNFKAVFPDRDPIIIVTPDRFTLTDEGLKTGQSHLEGMNLAKSAYCNGVFINKETYNKTGPNDPKLLPGVTGKNRGFIIQLFNCKNDEEFKELSKKNPFSMDGKVATVLVDAIKHAREYKNFVCEFNEKLKVSSS